MDVEVNPDRLAQLVPVGLEGLVAVGLSPPGQEQGVVIVQLIQSAVRSVKRCTISIEILEEHLRGRRREADRFDAPSPTPLATGQRFLPGSAPAPVANGEAQDLSDAGARLVGYAYHDLLPARLPTTRGSSCQSTGGDRGST